MLDKEGRTKVLTGIVAAIILMTGITSFLLYSEKASADTGAWTIHNVDLGAINKSVAIAVKPDGSAIGIAYMKDTNTVCYAESNDGGATWSIETVANDVNEGKEAIDLEYNSTGIPFILYRNNTSDIILAHKSGTSWITETICGDGSSIGQKAIVFTTDDSRPDLFLTEGSPYNLLHYYYSGGSWAYETVDDGSYAGRSVSAIYRDGTFYLTYLVSSGWEYAVNSSGSWTKGLVRDSSGSSVHALGGLAVKSDGTLVTAWEDSGSGTGQGDVYFDYSSDGTTWHTDTHIGGPSTYSYVQPVDIAVNSSDTIFIAWYNDTGKDLMISTSSDMSTWDTETVYSGNTTNGNMISPILSEIAYEDNIYIAFIAGNDTNGVNGNRDLLIATYTSGGGGSETIDITLSGYDANNITWFADVTVTDTEGNTTWTNQSATYKYIIVENTGTADINNLTMHIKPFSFGGTISVYSNRTGTWTLLGSGNNEFDITITSNGSPFVFHVGNKLYYIFKLTVPAGTASGTYYTGGNSTPDCYITAS